MAHLQRTYKTFTKVDDEGFWSNFVRIVGCAANRSVTERLGVLADPKKTMSISSTVTRSVTVC